MKRINKKLLEALDKLIAKYSGEEWNCDVDGCPLCDLYYYNNCDGCPNTFFKDDHYLVPCSARIKKFSNINYEDFENANTLKQFWTDYKSLYLQRIYSNSEIMEILIKSFKENNNE